MEARNVTRWLVAICALGMLAGHASSSVDASNEEAAKALRERAVELAERGELGEAIDVAHHAADLTPHDAEAWRLVESLQTQASLR